MKIPIWRSSIDAEKYNILEMEKLENGFVRLTLTINKPYTDSWSCPVEFKADPTDVAMACQDMQATWVTLWMEDAHRIYKAIRILPIVKAGIILVWKVCHSTPLPQGPCKIKDEFLVSQLKKTEEGLLLKEIY